MRSPLAGMSGTVLLLGIAAVGAAGAQGPPAQPDSARDSTAARLQAVTITGTRAAATVGGASAIVVPAAELRTSPAPVLEQALREVPFVHVRQNSRGEMELSVRGSDSRQAAVLLDGVPITLGWDHRTDPSLVPLTGSRRLVVVRGLSTLLNGPNTLGGTIEVTHADGAGVTDTGMLWAGGGIDENSAIVTSLGGSRSFASMAGGSLLLEGGVAHRDRDGYAVPSDASDPTASDGLRTNSDLRHTDAFASLRWRTVMGRSLALTVSGFDAERGVPPEEHISEPRLWRYPYQRRMTAALSASTGGMTTPFGYGSFDVGLGYNAGKVRIEAFTDRTYQTLDSEELGDESALTGRARLTHSLWSATLRAAATIAEVRYRETLLPAPGVDYRQQLFSGGAEVDVPLGAGTALSAGVVYDRSETPETGGRASQDPFDDLGWRLGFTHDFGPTLRFHASTSQRSRFPALRELYSGALDRFLPNPALKPENLLGFEAGFTLDRPIGHTVYGSFQVTGFRHNLDDAVVRITLPAPDRRFQRINRDRIESSGFELLGGLTFGNDPTREVTLNGDALFQSVSIHDQTLAGEPARHAENNPERRGSLELGVPLPWAMRGIAGARYTGTQYCLNSDTGSEMRLGAQTRSDLALERSFTMWGRGLFRNLRTLLALDNASDATVYDQCGLPQPGRTLRLMFTLR